MIINIFKEFALDLVPIPMQEDGLDLEKLEEQLQLLCKNQDKVFLYTIFMSDIFNASLFCSI